MVTGLTHPHHASFFFSRGKRLEGERGEGFQYWYLVALVSLMLIGSLRLHKAGHYHARAGPPASLPCWAVCRRGINSAHHRRVSALLQDDFLFHCNVRPKTWRLQGNNRTIALPFWKCINFATEVPGVLERLKQRSLETGLFLVWNLQGLLFSLDGQKQRVLETMTLTLLLADWVVLITMYRSLIQPVLTTYPSPGRKRPVLASATNVEPQHEWLITICWPCCLC